MLLSPAAHEAPPAPADRVRAALGGRMPALDGLRGIAILLVLLHNCVPEGARGAFLVAQLEALLHLGWAGVHLFFVLSGFLITGILLDWRGAPRALSAFYARRALRIVPLHLAFLALFTSVLAPGAFTGPLLAGGAVSLVPHWLFVSNWTDPLGLVPGLSHFWSLAVEEQFYLLWPFVVLRSRTRTVGWICLALVGAALAARVLMMAMGASVEAIYTFTVTRMDALALGGWLAAIVRDPGGLALALRSAKRAFVAAAAILAALVVGTGGFHRESPIVSTVGHLAVAAVGAAVLLLVVAGSGRAPGRAGRLAAHPLLRILGKYSFGLYVVHRPLELLAEATIGPRFSAYGGWSRLPAVLAYLVVVGGASLLVAVVSFHCLEMPFLRWKGRFTPGDAGPPL